MATYKIFYFQEAKQDIKEAKKWYRVRQKGLEKRFAEDIRISILRLRDMPFVHAVRYKNIRVAHADKFPYSLHFYTDESDHKVVTTAILHNSRNPALSANRITS